jgi:hypothetical protein
MNSIKINVKKDKITKKSLKEIKENTASVQPDVARTKDTEGLTENDIQIYDYMNEKVYKDLCAKDLSFCLTWVSPETRKTFLFYRFYHLDNNQQHRAKYFDSMLRIGKSLFSFITNIKLESLIAPFNYSIPNEVKSETNKE